MCIRLAEVAFCLAWTISLTAMCWRAPAAEVEVLFDGAPSSAWDAARDAKRLAEEFALSEVKPLVDPAAIAWRFVPRAAGFNDLFLRRPIERDFTSIRVRVRNVGAGFSLAAKVGEAGGAEWTTARTPLAAAGDWQWIEFPRSSWQVAGWSRDANGKVDFPLSYFTLIAFDIKTGREYQLQIARVEVVHPDRPRLTLHDFQFPRELHAGQTARFSLTFSLDKAGETDDAQLAFRGEKNELQRIPLSLPVAPAKLSPHQRVVLRDAELRVPLYARGGKFTAAPEVGGSRLADPAQAVAVTLHARQPRETVAEVKLHGGVPTLFINGQAHSGMSYMTYRPDRKYFGQFARIGVHLYSFSATPSEAAYGLAKTCWVAPDRFDYSGFEERVKMLLDADPEAYFFPRLYLSSPRWWDEKHPDDLVTFDPGDGRPQPFFHSPADKRVPSWASEAWRRDTATALRRFIEHVQQSPYADRVVGYHLASGTTEEWMMWGGNEGKWVDFSPANVARFRQWLRAKYRTAGALQSAWADPAVTFENATIPSKRERETTRLATLRDPQRERRVIDFYDYNADLVADTIACLAKVVKESTRRKGLVGVFYGYVLQLCGEQRQQNAGHTALEKVWSCPDVDFLTSPTSYAFRTPGTGYSHFMSLTDSVKLHGKLWFDENDIRTWLLEGKPVRSWGQTESYEQTRGQLQREFANVLCQGVGQWWFDMGGGWYDDPRILADIGTMNRIAEASLAWDRSAADEVAVVVDDRSLHLMQVANRLSHPLLLEQLPELGRLGAPVGFYALGDLDRLAPRKMYVFLNAFAPNDAERRAIERLKAQGRVLVWVYAPGVYREGRLDPAAMEELTGLHIAMDPRPARLEVKTGSGTYGASFDVAPVFFADDPRATVLGRLANGRAGLVRRDCGAWTTVYSAAPKLPATLLRELARQAGVHCYLREPRAHDVVYANRSLVALCVSEPGPRTVVLPRACDVFDLFEGAKPIATATREFTVTLARNQTKLFRLSESKAPRSSAAAAETSETLADALQSQVDRGVQGARAAMGGAQAGGSKLDDFRHLVEAGKWTELWPGPDGKPQPREVAGEVWTAAIQAALAKHNTVTIPARPQPYYLDAPIVLKSGQSLVADAKAEIRLKPGINTCMVRNEHIVGAQNGPVPADVKPDRDILIEGGIWTTLGTSPDQWNGNTRGRSAKEKDVAGCHGVILLSNVRGVAVRNVVVRRSRAFGVHLSNCCDFVVEGMTFEEHGRDGVHLNGPSCYGVIRNVRGVTYDDLVALNAWEWLGYTPTFGPIHHVLVEDVIGTGCASRDYASPYPDGTAEIRLLPGTKNFPGGVRLACDISDCVFRRLTDIRTVKLYDQPNLELGRDKDFADPIGSVQNLHFNRLVLNRPGRFQIAANVNGLTIDGVELRFALPEGFRLVEIGPMSATCRFNPDDPKTWTEIFSPDRDVTVRGFRLNGVQILQGGRLVPLSAAAARLVQVADRKPNPDYPKTTPRGGSGKARLLP